MGCWLGFWSAFKDSLRSVINLSMIVCWAGKSRVFLVDTGNTGVYPL